MTAAITEDWVPVALAADVPKNTAHPVLVDEQEVVIWRASGDEIHAWQDRCPHRGMRLSFGFVRNDRLVCLYHGWEYGEGGNCQRIPAHPDLKPPKTICSTAYGVRQDGGIVFVNLGAEDAGREAETGEWNPVRSIYVAIKPDSALERLAAGQTSFGKPSGVVNGRSLILDHPAHGQIRVAVQNCGAGRTGLHVTCAASDPAAISALAALAVRARRELETI